MSDPQATPPVSDVTAEPKSFRARVSRRIGPDFRDSFVLALGAGFASAFAVTFSVYCGRQLGPAAYSVLVAILSLVTLGNVPAGPINATLARFAAQFEAEERRGALRTLFRSILRGTVGRGLLVLLLLLPALPLLQRLLRMDSLEPLTLGYVLIYATVVLSVPRGLLRGLQRFSGYNAQILTENGARLLIGLVLVALWPTASVALLTMVLAMATAMVLAVFQLRPYFRGVEAEDVDLSAARRFFGPAFAFNALFTGFRHGDILLVKALFAPDSAGQYGAAATLARAVTILVTPFLVLLLPRLVSQRSQGRPVRGLLLRIVGLFGLVSAGVVGLFLVAGEPLIHTLLGESFGGSVPLLIPLVLYVILINLAALLAQPLLAQERFSFLWFYGPLFLVQNCAIAAYHPSLLQVSWILVAFGTLASLVLFVWLLVESARLREPGKTR